MKVYTVYGLTLAEVDMLLLSTDDFWNIGPLYTQYKVAQQ